MSNVLYSLPSNDGIGYGELPDGTTFLFDAILYFKIKNVKFYRSSRTAEDSNTYIIDNNGKKLHRYLLGDT
jgi:hypothetical protein